MSAGYSGTPLPKKLGYKDGQRALFVGLPQELAGLAQSAAFAEARVESELPRRGSGLDIVHVFAKQAEWLDRALDRLRPAIKPEGVIWVSWPKKAAKVATDLTENVVRDLALRKGLVDVKVCAVDEVWSGLKLVIRKELR